MKERTPRQPLRVRFPCIAITLGTTNVRVDVYDKNPTRLAVRLRLSAEDAAVVAAALQAAATQAAASVQYLRELRATANLPRP
jgi:hypothetical protein